MQREQSQAQHSQAASAGSADEGACTVTAANSPKFSLLILLCGMASGCESQTSGQQAIGKDIDGQLICTVKTHHLYRINAGIGDTKFATAIPEADSVFCGAKS